ncbi:MAG: hypothetical protein LUO89_12105 [Methanothrix sp.]|nr:hypothetical protein [Methanothrix sp.]
MSFVLWLMGVSFRKKEVGMGLLIEIMKQVCFPCPNLKNLNFALLPECKDINL